VVGRHLRQARRACAELVTRLRRHAGAARHHVAGLDEGDVVLRLRGAGHGLVAEAHELVDVELVVREQHEVLEVLGRRAGVVAQAVQRVIDARRGEQRQRVRLAAARLVRAVGDAVVHRAEVGQVEDVAHQLAPLGAHRALDVVALGEGEVHRNRLRAGADLERHAVVAQQQAELLEVVVAEQLRPRQRGLVGAGAGHEAVGEPRIGARHGVGVHAHEGVAGAHVRPDVLAGDEAVQRVAQVGDAGVVDGTHLGQGALRVVEAGGGDEGGLVAHAVIVAGFGVRRFAWDRIRPKLDLAAEDSANSTDAVDLPRKIPVHPR